MSMEARFYEEVETCFLVSYIIKAILSGSANSVRIFIIILVHYYYKIILLFQISFENL